MGLALCFLFLFVGGGEGGLLFFVYVKNIYLLCRILRDCLP